MLNGLQLKRKPRKLRGGCRVQRARLIALHLLGERPALGLPTPATPRPWRRLRPRLRGLLRRKYLKLRHPLRAALLFR